MPKASKAAKPFGPSWMPAPISPSCGACSSTLTENPRRVSASAAARPPIPPPATSTGSLDCVASMSCLLIACTDHQYTEHKCSDRLGVVKQGFTHKEWKPDEEGSLARHRSR